jgi:hypothetical protein
MIQVEVTVDLSSIEALATEIENSLMSALSVVAAKYLLLQRQRIAAGKSVDGAPFLSYSPGYRNQKTEAGRMGANFWLRLTGEMLRSQIVVPGALVGSAATVSVEFEGMHAPTEFIWRKKPKKGKGDRVYTKTVQARIVSDRKKESQMIPNALLAAVNDELRPFVGVSSKELDKLEKTFANAILEAIVSGISRNTA